MRWPRRTSPDVAGRIVRRWRRFEVVGDSMRPTLGPGDVLLVRPADQAREGQVVAARFLAGPRHIVVKRVNGRVENGYWLASDDPDRGRDSRQHGPAQVVGLVLLAWPGDGGWLRRLVPTTVRSRQPARER